MELLNREQCLICKHLKNDPNAVYTSDGEMICQLCQDWIQKEKEEVEELEF